jgi:hypothetical protein
MECRVTPTPYFEGKYKRLSKKFPSLSSELEGLEADLMRNSKIGESLGANLYKIRLASKDKGKGKSGGFRVITYLVQENKDSLEIFLITIFDKTEESSISATTLKKLVKTIFND